MAYRIIDVDKAAADALKKPFAVILEMSSVYSGSTGQDWKLSDELLEAHFFDEDEEIRIFNSDGEMKAVCIYESPDEVSSTKICRIDGSKDEVVIKQILAADNDGQYSIRAMRMAEIRNGGGR